jgi:hypothetical protein
LEFRELQDRTVNGYSYCLSDILTRIIKGCASKHVLCLPTGSAEAQELHPVPKKEMMLTTTEAEAGLKSKESRLPEDIAEGRRLASALCTEHRHISKPQTWNRESRIRLIIVQARHSCRLRHRPFPSQFSIDSVISSYSTCKVAIAGNNV